VPVDGEVGEKRFDVRRIKIGPVPKSIAITLEVQGMPHPVLIGFFSVPGIVTCPHEGADSFHKLHGDNECNEVQQKAN